MTTVKILATPRLSFTTISFALALGACKTDKPPAPADDRAKTAESASTGTTPADAGKAEADPVEADEPGMAAAERNAPNPAAPKNDIQPNSAALDKPAPLFDLLDLDGKKVSLGDLRGKVVVLEWFNPQCPFVKAAHTKGSLVDTAKKLSENGVVYLAINSGAPGNQGHGVEVNQAGKAEFSMNHPVLLDEDGSVGRAYGATNTPHIYVIDEEGVLRYRGAIDNSKDGEGASPEGGTLVNYLTAAIADLSAKRPVSVKETKAYGCSVKYAK